LSEKALTLLNAVILGAYVARTLGPSDYGVYSLWLSYLALATVVSGYGLNPIVIKDFNNNEYSALRSVFNTRFIIALVLSLLIVVIILVFPIDTLFLYIIIPLLMSPMKTLELVFVYEKRSKIITLSRVLSFVLSGVLKIYAIIQEMPILFFVYIFIIELLFYYLFLSAKMRWTYLFKNIQIRIDEFKSMIIEHFALFFSALIVVFYMRSDQLMLAFLSADEEIGFYATGSRLVEMLYLIFSPISVILYTKLAERLEQNKYSYERFLRKSYAVAVIYGFLSSLVLFNMSHFTIVTLFGSDFSSAVDVFKIMVFGVVFTCVGMIYNNSLVLENKSRHLVRITTLGLLLNLTSNLILIPIYGAKGAAYGTVLSQVGANFFYDFLNRDTRSHLSFKWGIFLNPRAIIKLILN
jgi:O-antigen/teichoic acid export membrane protein